MKQTLLTVPVILSLVLFCSFLDADDSSPSKSESREYFDQFVRGRYTVRDGKLMPISQVYGIVIRILARIIHEKYVN